MRLQPEAIDVVAAIREEDAYEPDGYTLYSYGAVKAWAQAVEQAGSLETKLNHRCLQHISTFQAPNKLPMFDYYHNRLNLELVDPSVVHL